MKKTIKLLVVALLMFCTNVSVFAAPSLAAIKKVKAEVENVRYKLPIDMGNGLTLTQMAYDSQNYTIVYRYHYSVPVTKPSANTIKESKLAVIHMLKANPNSEDYIYLKEGFTYHYNYYTMDGDFLYAIKITPQDIK